MANAHGGIFDTLFGVVKTVVNNGGKIQVGDIVQNIAMTNMINLPMIPGVDNTMLLNGIGGLIGMKIGGNIGGLLGGGGATTAAGADPTPDPSGGMNDPDPSGGMNDPDPSGGMNDPDPSGGMTMTNTGGTNWFQNFFMPNAGGQTDPSNNWLNILGNFAGMLNGGKMTTPPNNPDPNAGGNDPDPNAGGNDPDPNAGGNDPDPNAGGNDPAPINTGASNKPGVGQNCNGVVGTCLDSSVSTCSRAFLTGKCPGPREVRCCPAGGIAGMVMGGQQDPDEPVSQGSGSCSAYGGLNFPLASGSLAEISVNWGGPRNGGTRCHAGIDIYTTGARSVVAMSDGEVSGIIKGWYTCGGTNIDAIFVYHSSGALAGKTINYGEVESGSYSVSVGSRVTRGQRLAVARSCGMLHLELYSGRVSANQRWQPASGRVGSGCAGNSLSTKPSNLLDPRPLIRCTMPSGARFRNGVGFLNSGEITEMHDQDEGSENTGLEVGGIIGIVVAFLALCAIVVAVAVYFRVRRARTDSAAMSVPNQVYAAGAGSVPADLGHFNCQVCGKEYNYANDLAIHMQTRHPSA